MLPLVGSSVNVPGCHPGCKVPIFSCCIPYNSLLIVEKTFFIQQLSFFFVEQDPDLMAAFGDLEAMVALQDGRVFHSNSSPVPCMLQLPYYS
jgi:hypothetical protein